MSEAPPPHDPRVLSLLQAVEADRAAILKIAGTIVGVKGARMYPLDIMAIGAVKRNVSTAAGFRKVVESWNMVCARSLLRIHLDTALRFSAAWLVEDPHAFAREVLKGERIDKMKNSRGQRLTDAYLIELRSAEYPWLPRVYKNLSGYVHFSGSHIYDSVAGVDEDERSIEFEITEFDTRFPAFSWIEVVQCFREGSEFLVRYLRGYGMTKSLSPTELAAMKTQLAAPSSKPTTG